MRIGKLEESAYKRINKHIRSSEEGVITAIKQTVINYDFAAEAAFIGALNELTAAGIKPAGVSVGLIIPIDETGKYATAITEQLSKVSLREAVPIINVNAAAQNVNEAILTVTAIGITGDDKVSDAKKDKAGDVVIAGIVAGLGTAVIAQRKRAELCKIFSEPFVNGAASFKDHLAVGPIINAALSETIDHVFPFSEGGVFSGLWDMAEKLGVGMNIDLKKIPIKQETIELSEVFQINPYLLDSTGAVAMITSNGAELENRLRLKGINAAYVGTINGGNDRILVNDGEVRYIDRPQEDELFTFLKNC